MRNIKIATLTLSTLLALSTLTTGCATHKQPTKPTPVNSVTITVLTQPRGGIVAGGERTGIAPLNNTYDLTQYKADEQGCYLVEPVTATWKSGATASVTPKVCDLTTSQHYVTIKKEQS
jgi:hypothetical protein